MVTSRGSEECFCRHSARGERGRENKSIQSKVVMLEWGYSACSAQSDLLYFGHYEPNILTVWVNHATFCTRIKSLCPSYSRRQLLPWDTRPCLQTLWIIHISLLNCFIGHRIPVAQSEDPECPRAQIGSQDTGMRPTSPEYTLPGPHLVTRALSVLETPTPNEQLPAHTSYSIVIL